MNSPNNVSSRPVKPKNPNPIAEPNIPRTPIVKKSDLPPASELGGAGVGVPAGSGTNASPEPMA